MDRDNKIEDLVGTMNDMYAFMIEAKSLDKIKSHANILAAIAKQTTECAYFIQEYAETKGFCMSLSTSALIHT
jgi:hypothetical protein